MDIYLIPAFCGAAKRRCGLPRIRALVSGMPGASARRTKPVRIMSAGSVLAVSAARRVRARVECLLDEVDTEPRSSGQFQSTFGKFWRIRQKLSCQLLFRLRSNRLQNEEVGNRSRIMKIH